MFSGGLKPTGNVAILRPSVLNALPSALLHTKFIKTKPSSVFLYLPDDSFAFIFDPNASE